MSYPIFVIFAVFIITQFSWTNEIAPVMMDRVPGESFLNPFDISQLRDFNLFALIVGIFGSILNRGAWLGNDTSTSGKTPHEQKMAAILGTWRIGFSYVMLTMLVVAIITFMAHEKYSGEARDARVDLVTKVSEEVILNEALRDKVIGAVAAIPTIEREIGVDPPLSREDNPDSVYLNKIQETLNEGGVNNNDIFQEVRTLYFQTMAPMTLKRFFGPILMGLFCLLMIMLMLSTDTSRIFNASATFLQDVVMPLRKKPFEPDQHLFWLRASTVGIGVIFFVFSFFVAQMDYLNLFLTIIGAIWLGGSGPVIIFGLYSRFGTTAGAWGSMIFGSGLALTGIFVQRNWAATIYPFLEKQGYVESIDRFLRTVSSPFNPYIAWEMDAVKFPINSYEILFMTMLGSIFVYILFSKLSHKEPYNLERMLHRGEYDIDGEHKKPPQDPKNIKKVLSMITGIGPEHTKVDRAISWSVFGYTIVFQFFICFVCVAIWNVFSPWPLEWWSHYFLFTALIVKIAIGIVSTVWFSIGGAIDMRRLFRDLAARVDNPLDDGWVEGNVSVVDLEHVKDLEKDKSE